MRDFIFELQRFVLVTGITSTNTKPRTTFSGTADADSLTNSGSLVTINGNGGNDTIKSHNAEFVLINGGNDTNVIYNGYDDVYGAKFPGGNGVTINGGNGNNYIHNGDGNDSWSVRGGDRVLINGGNGYDGIINYGDFVTINGGNGNNRIYTRGYGLTINVGDDDDSIDSAKNFLTSVLLGAGNDSFKGSGDSVTVYGGTGNDYIRNYGSATIYGGDGNDSLDGGGSFLLDNEVYINGTYHSIEGNLVFIDGGNGDDSISGSGDFSTITGGEGNDYISGGGLSAIIDGGNGNDSIKSYGKLATVYGGMGDDHIENSGDSVTVDTGAGNNVVSNRDAHYVLIRSYRGDDNVFNNGGRVTIDTDDGNDTISNYGYYTTINSGAGNDSISNEGDAVSINSGTGDDSIDNGGYYTTITTGVGIDSIVNGGNYVLVDTGADEDVIYNGGGAVSINAGTGEDSIKNNGGAVSINAGAGNDSITNLPQASNTTINGDDGNDFIDNYSAKVMLNGNADNDSILTDNSDDVSINGGTGDDSIVNYYGEYNFIDGDDGDDYIENRGGGMNILSGRPVINVTVMGGAGNDTIRNSGWRAYLDGGDGDDVFELDSNGRNAIVDCTSGNDTVKVNGENVFNILGFGLGDVIELSQAANNLIVYQNKVVAGILTLNNIDSLDKSQVSWQIDEATNTATAVRVNTKLTLSEDKKHITYEIDTSAAPEEIFTISGLKSGVTVAELQSNVNVSSDTTVTVNKNILGTDDVSISDGYTLALADSVPKSEEISANWNVNDSTVTYTSDYLTEGYLLVDGTIVYRAGTESETFTLTGVKKNLTNSVLNANVTIEGTQVTLNENVLGDSNISISSGWTLALADTVPQSEPQPATWDISSAGETSKAIYTEDSSSFGYALVDGEIIYISGTSGGTFTLTGLSATFSADDVSFDGQKIILSANALAERNIILTTTDGYTLKLGEDCPAVTATEKSWTLDGTTATYNGEGKSGGYKLATPKIVTYAVPVENKTLLTVNGLKSGLDVVDGAIAGLTVEGKTLNVTPEIVGENLSVSSGYKVVFASGNYGSSKFTGTTGKDTIEVNGNGLLIDGDAGNDKITSNGAGGNVYLFASTDGKDTITGYGDNDTIKITDGSTATASVKGNNVILVVGRGSVTLKDAATGTRVNVVDANDEILIDQTFYKDRIIDSNSATLTSAFKDKTFTADDSINNVDGSATTNKFTLTGGDEDNTLIGGKGANFINGDGGENILTGGKGSDTFVAGNGNDTITDYGVGADKISLGAALTDFSVENGDVVLNFDEGKSLTIQNGDGKKINFIQNGKTSTELFTVDGKMNTAKTSITLPSSTDSYTASKSMVTIDGGLTDSVWIVGNTKANKIFGGDNSDTLDGGKGNDTLTGRNGNDIFVYETGKDVITDYVSGEDKISLSAVATSEKIDKKGNVILQFGSNSLTIKKVGDIDSREITFVGDDGNDITKTYYSEKIIGDDGVTLQSNFSAKTFAADDELPKVDASAVTKNFTLTGGNEDDTLIGGKGANLFNSGAGDDLLVGNGGNDTFVYSSGNDTIGDYETKDKISLTSAIKDFDLSGDDVIIGFDEGSLTIQDSAGKEITFVEMVNGKVTKSVNVFTEDGIFDNTTTKATTAMLAADTPNFDAKNYSKPVSIADSTKSNKIYAGDAGSTINGGKGNDSLWGGDGSDTFIYESGGGKDTIYAFGNEDALQIGNFTATVKDKTISFNVGSQTNAIVLKDYTATTFNINNETYRINGNELKK